MIARKLVLTALFMFGASTLSFGGIYYACDPSISSATCNYLNTTVASYYSSVFSNANATIYITSGSTALGESTTGYFDEVTYSTYLTALTNNSNKSSIDTSALAALNTFDTPAYGGGNVDLTSALANALGITSTANSTPILGVDYSAFSNSIGGDGAGASCTTPGNGSSASTCYNGIITTSSTANFYYENLGGSEGAGQYNFYAVVQHETDEILGTASCISTTSTNLTDDCPGSNTPSAVDLFRYYSAGGLALNSTYAGTPGGPAGAYFSFDGGNTNGAAGFDYNTSANGFDYADFAYNGCASGPFAIQDAVDCGGGLDAGLTILNDGGAEINILNAVGFDLEAPEPGTLGLLGVSLLTLVFFRKLRLR